MAKTYGEKPIIFAFEENGEQYMIGSEVSFEEHFMKSLYYTSIYLSIRLEITSVYSEELSTKSIQAWQEEI